MRYIKLGASSMPAWEFAKALHLQARHGWARFISMQHHYNLLAREEEREMIPLCLDEGVGTIIWSPLARGRLARAWQDARSTVRSETDGWYADLLYPALTAGSDQAIVESVGRVAQARGVSRAQVALAWLRSKPAVTAPLVGAGTTAQIDDAVAALDLDLTSGEIAELERRYTPRHDFQGVSDEAELQRIRDRIPGYANA
ncbi:aldo/keto reductase [Dactylosporangium sp. CA-139066]|uniref:aldo/keto reductase n=1 Tax=Dactylosporangium sp. CA-139066 TaxID=3239930 RepID=UPI003D8B557D